MVFDLQTNFSRGLEEENREQNEKKKNQLKRKLIICFNEKEPQWAQTDNMKSREGKECWFMSWKRKSRQCKGLFSSLCPQSLSQTNPQHRSCPIPNMFPIQDYSICASLRVFSSITCLFSTKLKGVEDLKSILTSDMRVEFRVCPGGIWSSFGLVFSHSAPLTIVWNGNVDPVALYVGSMESVFRFRFYRGLQLRDYVNHRRDFELWTFRHFWDHDNYRNFWSWTGYILHYDMAISIYRTGTQMWWSERKWSPKEGALLGNVALVEGMWPCWWKCITIEVGFEVTYMFKPCPVWHTPSCCLWY